MKVFILTNFSAYLKSYSPIIVVGLQIQMLKQNGHEPVLIVSEGWESPEDSVFAQIETRYLPKVPVSNEPGLDGTFDVDVEEIHQALASLPADAVVLTHDLIFLPDYVKHNVAARNLAKERPKMRWLHWIHSATAPLGLIQERQMYGEKYVELLNEKFPNSIAVFPNACSIPRVARNFSYREDEVFEVPHPSDASEGMEPIVRRLYSEKKLYLPKVLMVYPLRLDRGKNAQMSIQLLAGLKREGASGKLIFCDFQSTGGDKVTYREELKALAGDLDVAEDVIFMSEFDESAQLEISHKAVLDLFTLSNVFLMPSRSETYSLVTQEAMMRGNFCIVNYDFTPFRQIFGGNAIYKPFGANVAFDGYDGEIVTTYADKRGFFEDLGKDVIYHLLHDRTIQAKTWVRTKRNLEVIFKKYLEPLLYRRDEDG